MELILKLILILSGIIIIYLIRNYRKLKYENEEFKIEKREIKEY